MKILRVDMGERSIAFEEEPESYQKWWGRGLIAKILTEEMDPTAEPLGPNNIFIVTRGPLAGTGFSSSGRVSVGGKSPLTGGIKEANAGGNVGEFLARLAIKAIVVKGQAPFGFAGVLVVDEENARIEEAPELKGVGIYQAADLLRQRFGDSALVLNGPAADFKMNVSAVMCTDREGVPGRAAGRGGLGAVMASKGLKAIVLRPVNKKVPLADEEAFVKVRSELNKYILENPMTSKVFSTQGTASMVNTMYHLGGLPTRNFSHGQFEKADNIRGTTLHQVITQRGGAGTTGHPCMAGCLVRCSNIFPDSDGKEIVRALEYETLVMMGSNLGIGDVDAIARFNRACNDLGVDTIETGAAIAVAMDAGLWKFGDVAAVEEALEHVRAGDILGRVLGAGAEITGKVLGWHRVPTVKGQALAAYDPRAVKGMGVTYATSPMGADHTAGHTVAFKVDHHSPEGQVDVSRISQVKRAAYDVLDLCSFLFSATAEHTDKIMELVNSVIGSKFGPEDFEKLGRECLLMERDFNARAGIVSAHDRLPEFLYRERLQPYNLVFDVPREELSKLFSRL
ncbi:MAG TPA: aldehyde ferredoxin oxidoreductase [Firmicutes bacterium]|nr:aldehyde ferredoxin oxidoreductase [Candidatus Fermentithermobacillaceae bacterium]